MTTPIPQPPGLPIIGNLHQVDTEFPIRGFVEIAKTYGEIYKVNILGESLSARSTSSTRH